MTDAVADVSEITQLLYRYARAIDTKDWKALERVFTPDARIHYAVERGAELGFAQLGPWLAGAMRIFKVTQHVITNPLIELSGDTARCTSYLTATHLQVKRDGSLVRTTEGSRYSDALLRTPESWRISARRLDRVWVDGEYLGPEDAQLFD
ncbi:MAG TPA: nuclear transport factor 2 family protein [Myxococcota bacterium]|nr:nuclear transport factor 2 family protein [Myxococcota bacterium]